ncbi:putative Gnk2-like domain-containing protein [Helianthus annuus]|nr:putative Gnk2-like domain-containing protein [Helianthus annuus]
MAILVVLLVLLFTKPGFSQKTDSNNTNVIAMRCGRNTLVNQQNFIKNRNSTFRDLRTQVLNQRLLYARAQAISSGDSVFAAVQCRNYLSTDQCVACFDESVSELLICNSGNGGFISFDNCYVR